MNDDVEMLGNVKPPMKNDDRQVLRDQLKAEKDEFYCATSSIVGAKFFLGKSGDHSDNRPPQSGSDSVE